VVQTALHNKLASPGIIGVNAGAGLAVTICCSAGILSGWAIAGFSFLGAMIAVLLILFAAKAAGASKTTLILGGVAVNSILNALSEAICVLLPEAGAITRDFRVGGFYAVSTGRLIPAGILILIGLIAITTLCGHLDIIALGDETAHSLGVNVKNLRIILLVLAALLAGASVSFSGLLGFVGLLVPHAVRHLIGNENRKLIPLCVLFGSGFVTLCDLISRTVFAPYEIPVGIFLSVMGGPFFIYLLIRRKGGRTND
jgi:iron complex transport system permease protein